jgi:hypothetical protein
MREALDRADERSDMTDSRTGDVRHIGGADEDLNEILMNFA